MSCKGKRGQRDCSDSRDRGMWMALDSPEGKVEHTGCTRLWLLGTASVVPPLKKLLLWRWRFCQTGCQASPSEALFPLARI